MKIAALMCALVVSACAAPAPPVPAYSSQAAADDWRAYQQKRDDDLRALLAKRDAEHAATQQRLNAERAAAQQESDEALAVAIPQARACIMQNAGRLALTSGEAADIVADAALAACQPALAQVAVAQDMGGVARGATAVSFACRLRPWALSMVVEARARPVRHTAAPRRQTALPDEAI